MVRSITVMSSRVSMFAALYAYFGVVVKSIEHNLDRYP